MLTTAMININIKVDIPSTSPSHFLCFICLFVLKKEKGKEKRDAICSVA